MPCYHPLPAIDLNEYKQDLKKDLFFIDIITSKEEKSNLHKYKKNGQLYNIINIPCGQCIGCRLEYSKQWANRCMLEATQYQKNTCHFLTLTYDDEHATWLDINDVPMTTLIKKDLSTFIKKLRRYWEYHFNWTGIRFYACGEYGGQTHRAHYHIIIFNMPTFNLKFPILKRNFNGEVIRKGGIITDIWGKGHTSIAEMNWNTCAYVARYINKKITGKNKDQHYQGRQQEFTIMSRNPGIGKNYFEENYEKIYKNDEIIITGAKGIAQKIKPPEYYDKLYDLIEEENLHSIKEKRKKSAINREKNKLEKTNLTKKELQKIEEENTKNRIKKLKRSL